jgi:hypothetical protein
MAKQGASILTKMPSYACPEWASTNYLRKQRKLRNFVKVDPYLFVRCVSPIKFLK